MEVIEKLASLIHEQWMEWSKTLAKTEKLSPERLHRWTYYWRSYEDLDEKSKDRDRKWARRYMEVME